MFHIFLDPRIPVPTCLIKTFDTIETWKIHTKENINSVTFKGKSWSSRGDCSVLLRHKKTSKLLICWLFLTVSVLWWNNVNHVNLFYTSPTRPIGGQFICYCRLVHPYSVFTKEDVSSPYPFFLESPLCRPPATRSTVRPWDIVRLLRFYSSRVGVEVTLRHVSV